MLLAKKEFLHLTKVILSTEWIKDDLDKVDAFSHLLLEECENLEQQNLIIDLIGRFTVINADEYRELKKELCKEIESLYDENKTQIVAATADSNADSGQSLLYSLKSAFPTWDKHLLVNRYDHSLKEFEKKSGIHNNIVLIDDFIGSGRTMIGRIRSIMHVYNQKGYNPTISVKVIASTEEGLANLQQQYPNISITSFKTLKKGIDDFYSDQILEINTIAMNALEDKLSQVYEDRPLPKFGYNNAQALFFIQDVNTPNSVFPVFWWKYTIVDEKRPVLLKRAMADA